MIESRKRFVIISNSGFTNGNIRADERSSVSNTAVAHFALPVNVAWTRKAHAIPVAVFEPRRLSMTLSPCFFNAIVRRLATVVFPLVPVTAIMRSGLPIKVRNEGHNLNATTPGRYVALRPNIRNAIRTDFATHSAIKNLSFSIEVKTPSTEKWHNDYFLIIIPFFV
jgi:hypothetical protein